MVSCSFFKISPFAGLGREEEKLTLGDYDDATEHPLCSIDALPRAGDAADRDAVAELGTRLGQLHGAVGLEAELVELDHLVGISLKG